MDPLTGEATWVHTASMLYIDDGKVGLEIAIHRDSSDDSEVGLIRSVIGWVDNEDLRYTATPPPCLFLSLR